VAGGARELRAARSRQDRRRQQTRQGAARVPLNYLLPQSADLRDAQEYSRQVPTEEGAAFALRTGCLFVEASAKTAVGVTEAFSDVVELIIDTPALWGEEKDKPKASKSKSSKSRAATSVPGYRAQDSMPGNIDLSQVQEDGDEADGCAC
jgi:Ras-related protein Rab-18